jgi:PAS domain S-box-containing protein
VDARVVLAASILLQLAAFVLALRLMWVTGAGRAWGLISAALFLMVARRSISLHAAFFQTEPSPTSLEVELVALVISVLMVAGIALIAPLFTSASRSEAALRESERKLTALMGNLPGMAYRCANDAQWTMEFVSEGCRALTGYPAADLLGNRVLSYNDLIDPADRQMVWEQVQEAMAAGKPFRFIYRIRTASGEEKWVWEQGCGVYSAANGVIGLEGFITDITERRRAEEVLRRSHEDLEQRVGERTIELTQANRRLTREIAERTQAEAALAESEQRFRALVEATSDWIWEMDCDGVYTYASPKVKDLLEYKPDEVLGRRPFDFMSADEGRQAEEAFREVVVLKRPLVRLERVTLDKSGRRVILETSGVPILGADGNLRGYRGVDRDITKPKQDELTLKRTLAELEQSNRDLAQFAYSASHDLQEPLRMMGSYLQALQGRLGDGLDQHSRTFIELSLDASRRMQRLINDLLEYSRVGTRGEQFEVLDAGKVVDQAVANLQAAIHGAAAIVTRDELPRVTADPTLLTQLFQNLISNAVKFRGPQPPRVHVSCRDSGQEWTFSVRDNGIGFDPRHADRIFVVFERLHPQDRYPGTGIGLAICKRVVERHGGRIWCESALGEGAAFHFSLPKEQHHAENP